MRHIVRTTLIACAALAVAAAGVARPASAAFTYRPAAVSSGGVKIVEIYFDSPGADTGSNASLDAEWVKVKNVTGSRRTITGWTLRDTANHVYRFPTFTVPASGTVRVHTGPGRRNATNLYWGQGSYIWNNTGDTAILRNAQGNQVDRCHYTSASDPVASC
jgi:hypothetical protein